jgi:hypothetical protein
MRVLQWGVQWALAAGATTDEIVDPDGGDTIIGVARVVAAAPEFALALASLLAASERTAIVATPFTSSLLDGEMSGVEQVLLCIEDIRSLSFAAFTSAMQGAPGSCLSAWERSR